MTTINGWISVPEPYANQVFAKAGWDSVTLDAQHGLFDERALTTTLQALPADGPRRLVRLLASRAELVGRALDFGADGVIAPLINSVQEAAELAAACWYPPRGQRSFGPSLSALRLNERTVEAAAETIEVWAMIETKAGLAAAEGIAGVDGVTGLFVGPNDLALSLGRPSGSDREEAEMLGVFKTVINAAHAAGKAAGIFCASAAYAARMANLGFDMVTAGGDAALLGAAAAAAVRTAKGL
jgi:4-hydroxy-2-oxoheptanedioate aldolase